MSRLKDYDMQKMVNEMNKTKTKKEALRKFGVRPDTFPHLLKWRNLKLVKHTTYRLEELKNAINVTL